MASNEHDEKRKGLIDALTMTIHELHTLGVIVEDFQPNSQPVLFEKLNTYVKQLEQIDKLKDQAATTVPSEILRFLDKDTDNNPELFTREKLAECAKESDLISERLQALEILRSELKTGLDGLAKD